MAGTPSIAVVGPNGLIGREILSLLEERGLAGEIRLLGSVKTAGGEVDDDEGGAARKIDLLGPSSFAGVDVAFFAAGPAVAGAHAPAAAEGGTTVIDLSSRFRLDDGVPLVVPEVNADAIAERRERNIVASPSATAVALAIVLGPLAQEAGLRRVVVSTYQGVSGAGGRALGTLSRESADLMNARGRRRPRFARPIAFNCVPQVGELEPGGSTTHELRVVEETRKVLSRPELPMLVTAVRVPVFFGYALSVNVETESPLDAAAAADVLRAAPGVLLHDATTREVPSYPTGVDVAGSDATHVGRLRDDPSADPPGIALWIALDNVRKGAALNAVQIAEILVRDYL